ncbi:hypothetical protein RVR_8322 [Actinacidiphila reveromycinica]|uniref:HK97 gp10 family phage protein n=1 Tax=Actinacidiphila reveromycinica TaxID=659352 RepID=A0A7U3UYN7_9ACTN|nr:hypothetical protein [Streptomyces sp. SN-593]BBB01077.1 hypothetical protein RVR_8322 [Streptomyces sp. SN-593]
MAKYSGKDLSTIARELRKMDDKTILAAFRKELRKSAQPLVPAVRASIRRIPSSRPYSASGLRGQMSRATTLQVKTAGKQASVIIRVDGRKMPARAKAVQAYMEGSKPRWRHPVFGNTAAWVQQPAQPYFYKVMRAAGPKARLAVNRVISNVSKKIT